MQIYTAFRSRVNCLIYTLLTACVALTACADLDSDYTGEELAEKNTAQRPRVSGSFSQSNPMSDAFFNDTDAVSIDQVQRFLERSPYGRSWLADYTIGGKRASQHVHEVAVSKGLNPILLLSRMQVEASLISANSRPAQHLIDRAMGCGCPDGYACDPSYLGLRNQISCAATKFRELSDMSADGTGWWLKGVARNSEDGYRIVPQSHATAALYAYTPWVLIGSGGTWLAWKTAQLFDQYIAEELQPGSGGSVGCGQFSDLPEDHPGFSSVEAATRKAWISGCGGGRFCPEDSLTRAQAASVLKSAYELPPAGSAGLSDTAGHWAEQTINAVVASGLMSGCAEGRFCPDEELSRAQAAALLAKAAQVNGPSQSLFSDVPSDHWASRAISGLYERDYIGGCGDGQFCPDLPARRWIFITWLVNVERVEKVSCR